jgi:hypothetical protein
MQNSGETPVILPNPGVCEFALSKGNIRLLARTIHDEGAGLFRKIDQVEQLCNCEITKVAA